MRDLEDKPSRKQQDMAVRKIFAFEIHETETRFELFLCRPSVQHESQCKDIESDCVSRCPAQSALPHHILNQR